MSDFTDIIGHIVEGQLAGEIVTKTSQLLGVSRGKVSKFVTSKLMSL